MNDNIIETKVNEFVDDGKGFTSVDICNAIKTDGTWVRNREVAAWLRRWTPPVGYGITRISVSLEGGNTATAAVYLPGTMAVSDYTQTSQAAMTPEEFETLHGFNPVATVVDPAPVTDPNPDADDDGSHSASVGDKLRSLFHWAPGS